MKHNSFLYRASVPNYIIPSFYLSIYLFLERGKGEREGEKHQLVLSCTAPTGGLAHNPSMCPDGNLTGDLLVYRPTLHPLSHTSQGYNPLSSKIMVQEHVLMYKLQQM